MHCSTRGIMKIDFNASFRELSQLLNRGQTGEEPVPLEEFGSLMDSPSAIGSSEAPRARLSLPIEETKPPYSGPMISYVPAQPELVAPEQERSLPPMPKEGLLEGESGSQDGIAPPTPQIIEAKRIPSSAAAQYGPLVEAAGVRHGLDPALGMAVISAESAFDPKAISSDGHASKGLFQLLDSTGKHLMGVAEKEQEYDPFNPELNVDLGVGYLRYLHDLFSRSVSVTDGLLTSAAANSSSLEKLALAAFNAGEGRVASAQMRAAREGKDAAHYDAVEPYLPDSTKNYVKKVISLKEDFKSSSLG